MTVSRMHATLDRVPGGYKIVDADSFNGLWVNNLNMKEAVLNDGDVVQNRHILPFVPVHPSCVELGIAK